MNIVKATAKYEAWLAHRIRPADRRSRLQARADAPRAISLPARHLLPLGADLSRSLRGGRQGARRARRRRPARGELRNLARHRRPPDLGHQRFRRSLAPALYQRPDPAGHQRADGAGGLRRRKAGMDAFSRAMPKPCKPAAVPSRWPSITPRCAPWPPRACTIPSSIGRNCTRCPEATAQLPAGALKAIERMMPENGLDWHIVHRDRRAGQPRPRALRGDRRLARRQRRARSQGAGAFRLPFGRSRAKARRPSSIRKLLDTAVRCRDPFVRFQKRWIVRRLAPDCSRIELSDMPRERDEIRLLRAMGWETANVHLGGIKPRVASRPTLLKKRPRADGC